MMSAAVLSVCVIDDSTACVASHHEVGDAPQLERREHLRGGAGACGHVEQPGISTSLSTVTQRINRLKGFASVSYIFGFDWPLVR